MRRIGCIPRDDWARRVEDVGLVWHTAAGLPYWNESAAYVFTSAEIDIIEKSTRDLYDMFLNAGQYVIDQRLFSRFGILEWCEPLIVQAWEVEPAALNYGRFDLGFDGRGPPKLFEFNCDTPTSLLEAAVVQWRWKEDVFPNHDQFNSLHDKLVAKWRDIAPSLADPVVHFSHAAEATGEDAVTCAYLLDTAREAGVAGQPLLISDIGWRDGRFYDLQDREIRTLQHLYPWEWLVAEAFGRHIAGNAGRTTWVEPIWKMIWSNKAILPILWDLYPQHPNLLWASRDAPVSENYVRKPILAREGANVSIVREGVEIASTQGAYAGDAAVYQGLFDLPSFAGAMPVVGSWVVDGEPAGVGIREDGLITGNLSRFTPHIIHE